MQITLAQAQAIFGTRARQEWVQGLITDQIPILMQGRLDNRLRVCHFLAQVAHESGGLRVFEENLNYSARRLLEVFPRYFTPANVLRYHRQPEAIANRVYENRMGNGGEASGDGWRYRGRGPIQITGKDMYIAIGKAIGVDLENNPELLLVPATGWQASAWFWNSKLGLNAAADRNDIRRVTKLVNGGYNGLSDRQEWFERIEDVLDVTQLVPA